MIFHPLVLALTAASLSTSFMVLYASSFGLRILRRWDLRSGSESQLALERRTYLISTFLGLAFATELLSLFLFVFTADRIHGFFVGSMCAVGSLNVNSCGYPALYIKVVNFFLSGLWLILNHADNRGFDYPLIKPKYRLLLVLAPLVVAETAVQSAYFFRLRPDIITSCCGTLFSAGGGSLVSTLVSLPPGPTEIVFYLCLAVTATTGIIFYRRLRAGALFAVLCGVTFAVSILSILSFYSVYVYELPSHHCPFCILQAEYHSVGYPLYLALFGLTISGIGIGVLLPFRSVPSLRAFIPLFQKKLAFVALACLFVLFSLVTFALVTSNLVW